MTLLAHPVDALVSYYYDDDKAMTAIARSGRIRLIADSGAFSALTQGAAIDLGGYAAWVTRWRDHLCWAASLDVIGDPGASHRNWATLRDRHGIDAVPTIHAGADVSWLDAYASEGVDFVGLGGMAGTGQAVRAFRWALHVFRYARDRWPNMRFHLWGVTNRKFLDHLPAYSADSSGIFLGVARYGTLRLFDPSDGTYHVIPLGVGRRNVYRAASLLRRTYGIDPASIETSHAGNRTALTRLAATSTQQYAAWLQRRHGVMAPRFGVSHFQPIGTRIHLAGGPTDLLPLLDIEMRAS